MRKLLLACLLLAQSVAWSSVRYYLAYGDQDLVDIARNPFVAGGARDPNAEIGRAIPTDRPLLIPEIGKNFSVQVRLHVDSTTSGGPLSFNSGFLFLGIDTDTTGAFNYADTATFYSNADYRKIGIAGTTALTSISDLATDVPGVSGGKDGLVSVQFQGTPILSGRFGSGTTLRAIGIGFSYIFGSGNVEKVPVDYDKSLATVHLSNRGVAMGETWGIPNSEVGLVLVGKANATSRSNFVVCSPKADGYPLTEPSYVVEGFDSGAALNQPPTIDAIAEQTTDEETPLSVQFVAHDDDFPIHQLTFSLPGTPPTGASITPDGLLTYTPTETDGGTQRIILVRVSDYYNKVADTILKVTVREVKKLIQGSVLLQDFVGNPVDELLEIEFVRGDGSVASRRTGIILKPDGTFSFGWAANEAPAGTYQVRAKVSHWLSQVIGPVTVAANGANNLAFVLMNGDVDGDNIVSIFDYAVLSDAFDTRDGDPGFLPSADLDGDGWVTVWDYSILSQNFDRQGT